MLTDKIAVVTGASRGIGKAIAKKLASMGATVVINYNGSEEKAMETKREIEEAGGNASVYCCDVSDYEKCETFISDVVKEYGRLDILVNNAGITRDGLLMRMSEADIDDAQVYQDDKTYIDKIREAKNLLDEGLITDEEFSQIKTKIIGSI